ncbi:citramalate synthase [Catenulispora yoronensis]|uniref:Citramalate synthase n=1 Tax=Catenulispora yoronensis TaxID=450799 RepID=A0ABN2UBC8_9ACTN
MSVTDDFHVYDTTLRDGTQQEGLSLAVADKLAIARHLDALGVGFIEGGWPGAVPKDTEFFRRARTELDLKHAQLAAFGATRRAGAKAADDPLVAALRESGAPVVTLVAKSHVRHVELALRTTLAENLAMIQDTVSHLRAEGQRVFLDAEHFFDGYRADAAYALECLRTAAEAGADVVVLCDTNGGMLPPQLADIVHEVREATAARIGIHTHDDASCAVANALAAVDAGATHVQGTANGYGERSGNANLFSVVANLQLKLGREVIPPAGLAEMTRIAHAVSEVTNLAPNPQQPYVGVSAFAHKAGLHASAVRVDPDLYQHIDPQLVGNDMRMLVSEMAGRASVELKGKELGFDLSADPGTLSRVTNRVKELEACGYSFEAADASFELLLRAELGEPARFFDVLSWRTVADQLAGGAVVNQATVKLRVKGEPVLAAGEGNGPVNALDIALRAALAQAYPALAGLELVDYKVRILTGDHGTASRTRVLITTSDGAAEWATVGVGENVVAASWQALVDAVTYGLLVKGEPVL